MKRIYLFTVIGLALISWNPLWVAAADLDGAKVYNDNCARCHQPRAPWEFSDRAWGVIIHHMHTRGYLTDQEMGAVLNYLQSSNKRAAYVPPAPPIAEAGPADGKALVAQFSCQGCHIIEGIGGEIGPSLDTLNERRDADYVMKKLSDPTFDNPRSVMPYFELSEAQTKAIADYLVSLSKQ